MRYLVVAAWAILFAPLAAAQIDTPSTLLLTGTVRAGNGIVPRVNDVVVIFNPATGAIEESGEVLSSGGLFSVTMTRTSAFDGTPLTLHFQQDGRRFQLYQGGAPEDGGEPADFAFRGGLVPRRASVTATIGEQVAGPVDDPGAVREATRIPVTGPETADRATAPVTTPRTGPATARAPGTDSGSGGGGSGSDDDDGESSLSRFDVNGDGRVDQVDVESVKDVVAGRTVTSNIAERADVNGDDLVNTRDIIAVIKAANRAERNRRRERVDSSMSRS